ncbi:MAG TPA: thioredoxin domain-containing protein [Ramlibacter sp.]|jgi:protein-disulfide isomerase
MNTRRLGLILAAVLGVLGVAGWLAWTRSAPDAPGDPQAVQSAATLVRPHAPVLGAPQAPVTVVEFFDPSCEACRAFHPYTKQLLADFAGKVRMVIRYAPFHQGSDEAVAILEAARTQQRFEAVLDALLLHQPEWAAHGAPNLELAWKLAADAGLDVNPGVREAARLRAAEVLAQDVADLKTVGVEKTPTFYVNGRPLARFHPDALRSLVEEELASGKPANQSR